MAFLPKQFQDPNAKERSTKVILRSESMPDVFLLPPSAQASCPRQSQTPSVDDTRVGSHPNTLQNHQRGRSR